MSRFPLVDVAVMALFFLFFAGSLLPGMDAPTPSESDLRMASSCLRDAVLLVSLASVAA